MSKQRRVRTGKELPRKFGTVLLIPISVKYLLLNMVVLFFFFVKHHSLKMFFTTRVENYRMKKALLERRRYSHSTINCRPLQQKPLSENVQIIFVVDWLKKQQNKNNGYKFFSNLAHKRLFDGYKIFILPFTFRLLLLIYVLVPTLVRTTVLV